MTREELKLLAIDTKLGLAEKMQKYWGYLLEDKEATKKVLEERFADVLTKKEN